MHQWHGERQPRGPESLAQAPAAPACSWPLSIFPGRETKETPEAVPGDCRLPGDSSLPRIRAVRSGLEMAGGVGGRPGCHTRQKWKHRGHACPPRGSPLTRGPSLPFLGRIAALSPWLSDVPASELGPSLVPPPHRQG